MNQHPILRHLYLFYTFVYVLFLVNVFIESEHLNYVIGILAIFMLIISFPLATRLFKILGTAFMVIGGSLFITTDLSIVLLPELFTSNMSLLLLLAMLPWMNSVVRSGRFDKYLNQMLKVNVSDLGTLYSRSTATTLIMASFLNLSAATITQDVLKENLSSTSKRLRENFIGMATVRGFTMAIMWSPLEVLLAVTIFMTGVSYVSILPWLLLITGIIYLLDAVWGRFYFKKYNYTNSNAANSHPVDRRVLTGKIVHLFIALSLFLTLVIVLGNLFNMDFILTVSLLILPFAFIWSLVMKRVRSFWLIGWNTWKTKTNTMQNFIVLFISLSFFSESINNTAFMDTLQQPILNLVDYPLIIFYILLMIFLVMSMFGVHPVATVGIVSGIVAPLLEIMNPLSIAIVMITSAIATVSVGTYGLVITLTSVNTAQNPYRITVNNMPYALILGSIGIFIGYLLL